MFLVLESRFWAVCVSALVSFLLRTRGSMDSAPSVPSPRLNPDTLGRLLQLALGERGPALSLSLAELSRLLLHETPGGTGLLLAGSPALRPAATVLCSPQLVLLHLPYPQIPLKGYVVSCAS